MCDNPCQPAHFRSRKHWLIFPHSSCHGSRGTVPLRPQGTGGGGLASAFKPCLRLRKRLRLVMSMMPMVDGSLSPNMTPRLRTTLTTKSVGNFFAKMIPLGKVFDNAPHHTKKASGPPLVIGSGPHGMLSPLAKSRATIYKRVTIHANRLILGCGKIGSYFRTAVVTTGREQRHYDRMGGPCPHV